MKKRYTALFMSAVMLLSQFAGAAPTVLAAESLGAEDEILVSEWQTDLQEDAEILSEEQGGSQPAAEPDSPETDDSNGDTAGDADDAADLSGDTARDAGDAELSGDTAQDTGDTEQDTADEFVADEDGMPTETETADAQETETDGSGAQAQESGVNAAALNLDGSGIFVEAVEELEVALDENAYMSDGDASDESAEYEFAEYEFVPDMPWVDTDVLINREEWSGLETNCNIYYKNGEYVTNETVTITNITENSNGEIVEIKQETEGYQFNTVGYGAVTVTVTFAVPEGYQTGGVTEGTYTYNINVCGDRWEIGLIADNNDVNYQSNLMPGQQTTLSAQVDWECDESYGGQQPSYKVDWSVVDAEETILEGENSPVTLAKSEDNGSYSCTVAAKGSVSEDTFVRVRACLSVCGEDGEDDAKRASVEWNVWIKCNGYYKIEVTDGTDNENNSVSQMQQLEPGESITVIPTLYSYSKNGEETSEQAVSDVEWRWEDWDSSRLGITENASPSGDDQNTDTASFTLTKLNNEWTDIRLRAYTEDGGDESVAEIRFVFNSVNYDVWFNDLRGGEYTWVLDNEIDYTFALNTDNLENRDAKIVWKLGVHQEDDTIETYNDTSFYSVSDSNASITVNGVALESWLERHGVEGGGVDVRVYVYAGNSLEDGPVEVARADTWLELRETKSSWDYVPNGLWYVNDALPGWWGYISKTQDCDAYNKKGAWRDYVEGITLTGITVEDVDGEKVLTVEKDDDGWTLSAENYGTAKVTVTFTLPEGYLTDEGTQDVETQDAGTQKEYTYEYFINVCGDRWDVDITADDGDVNYYSNLMPGESITLNAEASWECDSDEITPPDSHLDWIIAGGEGWESEEDAPVELKRNADGSCTVTAKPDATCNTSARVRATLLVKDKNGEYTVERASCEWEVWVHDGYYKIVVVDDTNNRVSQVQELEPGESVIINPALYLYDSNGEEAEKIDGVTWCWEGWDDNQLEIKDSENNVLSPEEGQNTGDAPFTLKKLDKEWTDMRLCAYENVESEEGTEGTREEYREGMRFVFKDLNYDVEFEGLRGDDGNTWVFNNEEYPLALNVENLQGRDVTIEWELGVCNEQGDFVEPISDVSGVFEVNKDQNSTSITADGEALKSWLEENGGGGVNVRAYVYAGVGSLGENKEGIEVARADTWLELREPRYEYSFGFGEDEHVSRLPGDNIWIDRDASYYEESSDYPNGKDWEITVTDVLVKVADGDAPQAVTCEKEEDENRNGWNLQLNNQCDATVTIQYNNHVGEPKEWVFYLHVVGELYWLNISASPDSYTLLPGEDVTLTATVSYASENGEDNKDDVTDAVITWGIEEENDLISLSAVGSGSANESETITGESCKVTAKANNNYGGASIAVKAVIPKDDGQEPDEVTDTVWIEVSEYSIQERNDEGGFSIETGSDQYLLPGETLTITPVLCYAEGEQQVEETGDIFWRWEYDGNMVSISPDNAEVQSGSEDQSFEITRKEYGWTEVALIAKRKDEDGNYQEAARRSWYLNDYDTSLWLDETREEGYTWVYSDEDVVLDLEMNDDLLSDNFDRQVVWTLYMWDDEEAGYAETVVNVNGQTAAAPEDNAYYDISDGGKKITLHGEKLWNGWFKERAETDTDAWMHLNVEIQYKAGDMEKYETIADTGIGLDAREPWEQWEDEDYDTLLLGNALFYDNGTITKYVENKDYPHGEEIKYNIKNIEVKNTEGGTTDVLTIEHPTGSSSWKIWAANVGEAEIIYTVYLEDESNTLPISQTKTVSGEQYSLILTLAEDEDRLFPGESAVLQGAVWYETVVEKEGWELNKDSADRFIRTTVALSQDAYYLKFSDWDDSLLEVNEKTGTVTALEPEDGYGETHVKVTAYRGANDEVLASSYMDFYIVGTRVEHNIAPQYATGRNGKITITPRADYIDWNEKSQLYGEMSFDIHEIGNEGLLEISEPEANGTRTISLNSEVAPEDTKSVTASIEIIISGKDLQGNLIEESVESWLCFCNHENKDEIIRAQPNCETEGKNVIYCTDCGYEEVEKIPANGHAWDAWEVTKAATCMTAGTQKHVCETCGKEETQTIAATGHTNSGAWTVTKAATCTAPGTRVQKCSTCQTVVKTETIPANGHKNSGVWTVTKAATCTAPGTRVQKCSTCQTIVKTETIAAAGHKWSAWQTTSKATVFAAEQQQRRCSVCGTTESRSVGTKLTPYVKLNATKVPLKTKQSTTKVKVTGMAEGDSIKSWKSSNTKIVKVTSSGKITAQNKAGKATVTVTMASGVIAKVQVEVKKTAVKTTKISGLTKSVKLEKGKKYQLAPVITPVTSLEKVTYTSSNKKIATVSSKGVITAKKAGKAKITVKSGSKKYVVTVTVAKTAATGIKGVPATVSLKKGKTYKLKAKVSPTSSDDTLSYSTSNKKVATVDKNGKITAKAKGKAVITVKAGKIKVTCTVTVK